MTAAMTLRTLFQAAIDSASPLRCVPPRLPPAPRGRTVAIGAGKAAAEMALAVERHWTGPLSGLVVVPYGHGADCARIGVIEAAHPISDQAGVAAAAKIVAQLEGLTRDDLVIALISGGGSALLAAPAAGLTLADKQAVVRALLRSGAPIAEINCVRKHLSAVKGGRLAGRIGDARLVTLAISDVPGDDPATIASGPTVPDLTTRAQALAILSAWMEDAIPENVRTWLLSPDSETPKPGGENDRRTVDVVATPRQAIEAAAEAARRLGLIPVVLGADIEGEAREVAAWHADRVRALRAERSSAPRVLLSGGETTVTVRGDGRGGRNTEFLLALALALEDESGVHALAADTDGVDGSETCAGAWFSSGGLVRARRLGVDPQACLQANDSHRVFEALDQLVVTGPTRTNVNDFRAVLIDAVA